MKQYLMPSYGEIMKHALTCKAIGAEVCSSVWCEFVLVKVNMNQLGVILYLNMYVCKFEPIQHVFRQKAFCKESILFHSYTLFYSLQRGQGIFIAINYTHVFSGDPEKRTKALVTEKQKVEAERDRALVQNRTLTIEKNKVIAQLNSQQANEQQRVENAVRLANAEKDKTIRLLQNALKASKEVLHIIADMLYASSDIFKRAVDAIIHYGTEKYKSIFGNDEAADIKNVMQAYGKTKEQQQAVGSWLCDYADSLQPFDEMRHRQTYKEVADVANGAYDWKIERGQENLGY